MGISRLITRKTNLTRNRRGITLIEMLVTAAVLSLATVALVSLLVNSLTGWNSATARDTTTSHATVALEKLSKDIRDGKQAQVSPGALVVTFPRINVDASTGESIYDASASDPVTRSYYVSGGNLVRSMSGVASTLARGVTSATFGAAGGTVSVTLTVWEQVGNRSATRELTGRIALRNYGH